MAAKREPDLAEYFSFQENAGGGTVPAFLSKLWVLVEDPSNDEVICWDQAGSSFHIYDQSRFAAEVLPYYFKHSNISSFIRQLNMYGFRKVPNMEQGALKTERGDLEFQHPFFMRGHEELIDRIKRKTGQARSEQRPVSIDSDSLSKVLTEVNLIKNKQDTFNTTMEDLKRENQILWREVIKVSQKYQQQQQIINKLMHFLLSLVNQHGGMAGISRKRPLMINAPEPAGTSETSPTKKANIVLNDPGDHDYTVQSPADMQPAAVPTTSGVVIQELLDHLEPDIGIASPQASGSFSAVNEVAAATSQSSLMNFLTSAAYPTDNPVTTVAEVHVFPDVSGSGLVLAPAGPPPLATPAAAAAAAPAPVVSVKQEKQEEQEVGQKPSGQPAVSQQIALRAGFKDEPLSASSSIAGTPVLAKEISEQMKLLQCDLESVRDALSTGQFNLDPNFILGLFDPETPLPVNIDSSLMDFISTEDSSTDLQTTSIPAQLPAAALESVMGNELSQYQPADMSFPNLFDELETGSSLESNNLPVLFDTEDSGLHTPSILDTKPSFSNPGRDVKLTVSDDGQLIQVEDLD